MAELSQSITFTEALVVGGSTPVPPRNHWRLRQNDIYALSIVAVPDYGVNTTVTPRRFDAGGLTPDRSPGGLKSPLKAIAEGILNQQGTGLEEVSFVFRMNPANLTQDAPHAIYMQPTFGGLFTDHRGQPFANISITGTTGLRPNAKPQSATVLGVSVPSLLGGAVGVDSQTGLPVGERTGFDDLVALRSIFKTYATKRSGAGGGSVYLLWTNAKTSEALIVEPVGAGLTIVRDKSSPLTASYSINLRVVESIDNLLVRSILNDQASVGSLLDKITRFASDLRKAVNFFASVTDRVRQIGQGYITAFISVVNSVSDGISNMLAAGGRIIAMPRQVIAQAVQSVITIANAIDNVTSQIAAYRQLGLGTGLAALKSACINAARSLAGTATERSMFRTTPSERQRAGANAYALPGQLAPTTRIADVPAQGIPQGAGRVVIRPRDTMRSIALRYLGSAAAWQVIARMNNLSPPFISPAGDGQAVLRPGDQILIPGRAGAGGPSISPASEDTAAVEARALDPVLGVDAKLLGTAGQGTLEMFDLALDATGDIARVRGQDNMNQAIAVKFAVEPGELPLHPRFGLGVSIGSRTGPLTLSGVSTAVRAALLSDERITGIDALEVDIVGSTISFQGNVQLRDEAGALAFTQSTQR